MEILDLLATLCLAIWLSSIAKISAKNTVLNITFSSTAKILKNKTNDKTKSKGIFSASIEVLDVDSDSSATEVGNTTRQEFQKAHHRWKREQLLKHNRAFSENSKFYPEYGTMFHDMGTIIPGLKQTYLFVSIDIPVIETLTDKQLIFPDCSEWAERNLGHWCGTEINPQDIRELIHQTVCGELNIAYRDLYQGIQKD